MCFHFTIVVKLCLQIFILAAKKKDENPRTEVPSSGEFSTDFSAQYDLTVEGKQGAASDLVLFSFSSVAAATNEFSLANKLGQGGFGHVYKVKFVDIMYAFGIEAWLLQGIFR